MATVTEHAAMTEIASLAHVSIEDVMAEYQSMCHHMDRQAKIHDYVPLLAMKHIREHFLGMDKQRPH